MSDVNIVFVVISAALRHFGISSVHSFILRFSEAKPFVSNSTQPPVTNEDARPSEAQQPARACRQREGLEVGAEPAQKGSPHKDRGEF